MDWHSGRYKLQFSSCWAAAKAWAAAGSAVVADAAARVGEWAGADAGLLVFEPEPAAVLAPVAAARCGICSPRPGAVPESSPAREAQVWRADAAT